MNKPSKIAVCIILILSITCSVFFFGCNDKESSSANIAETTDGPTAVHNTVSSATQDTPTQPFTWNYSRLKQNSDSLKSEFDNIITKRKFRGTAYVKIGNDFEYIGTNGFSNKDKHTHNSLDTCYRVASITKQFTAVAIMQLKEQGKILLDDTIDKYYPSYKYADKITVKNLLTMTAGLKDYINKDGNVESSSYALSQSELAYNVSADSSAQENKKNIMNWIFSQELNFEPDSKFMYSNSSYYLLGDIIEKVSGISYEEYIVKNLLEPAGMTSSGFDEVENLAVGYQDVYDNEWTLYPGVCYSAAGLISNVPDLLKWLDALCTNTIISEESFTEMTTPYKSKYGYGLFISGDTFFHSGKIDKYNAEVLFSENQGQVFIALSNYSQSDPTNIQNYLIKILSPYYG